MMTTTTSAGQDLISCEMCLREVPRSEAAVPEATDYVVYFCGLACYEQWKELQSQDQAVRKTEHE